MGPKKLTPNSGWRNTILQCNSWPMPAFWSPLGSLGFVWNRRFPTSGEPRCPFRLEFTTGRPSVPSNVSAFLPISLPTWLDYGLDQFSAPKKKSIKFFRGVSSWRSRQTLKPRFSVASHPSHPFSQSVHRRHSIAVVMSHLNALDLFLEFLGFAARETRTIA